MRNSSVELNTHQHWNNMAWTAASCWERWDPAQYILCPYDNTHRIQASRFQTHLVKCRKNHGHKDFVSCPFNASHQVLRPHLRSHICSCPDKNVVEPSFNVFGKDEQCYHLKGDTSVPSCNSATLEQSEEDWDQELSEDERSFDDAIEPIRPIQHTSSNMVMQQNREQIIREMKRKALEDDINQRWRSNSAHNEISDQSEAEQCFDTKSTHNSSRDQGVAKSCRQDSNKQSPLHLAGVGRGRLVANAYMYEAKCGQKHINTTFR